MTDREAQNKQRRGTWELNGENQDMRIRHRHITETHREGHRGQRHKGS